MQHKAFLFDHTTFELELRTLLVHALDTGECNGLMQFIESNLDSLSDPYEGDPLDETWQSLVETRDAHQLGDFALTRYYNPADDLGLGYVWDAAQQFATPLVETLGYSPILGSTLGPAGKEFDPGKMGSYFQSPQQVKDSLDALKHSMKQSRGVVSQEVIAMVSLLEAAVKSDKGLYVTF